jgi:hypothetical protein
MLNFFDLIHLFLPNMKRVVILLGLLVVFCTVGSAQRKIQQLDEEEAKKREELKTYEKDKKGFDKEKVSFGGNVGGAISNTGGFLMLQPMVGYYVLPKTMAGVGATYIYYSVKNSLGQKFTTNVYGPIVFARQQILPTIFAHGEWQPINYERYNQRNNAKERIWSNQLYLGGGYGGKTGVFVFALYDIMHNEKSFYANPLMIRVGCMF